VKDEIRRLVADQKAAGAQALALARLVRQPGSKQHPAAEYRCDCAGDRCLLLAAYPSPYGPLVYAPGYRYSPAEATRQGIDVREFGERAFFLDHLPSNDGAVALWAACDHRVLSVRSLVLSEDCRRGRAACVRRFLPDGTADLRVFR
jgi:hypothetical protein